jgi:hypothetical protein
MEAADLILAASGPRGEHLQGDLPAEALLLGLVDDPHAAAADLAEDPIVSQAVRGLFRGVAMPGEMVVSPESGFSSSTNTSAASDPLIILISTSMIDQSHSCCVVGRGRPPSPGGSSSFQVPRASCSSEGEALPGRCVPTPGDAPGPNSRR